MLFPFEFHMFSLFSLFWFAQSTFSPLNIPNYNYPTTNLCIVTELTLFCWIAFVFAQIAKSENRTRVYAGPKRLESYTNQITEGSCDHIASHRCCLLLPGHVVSCKYCYIIHCGLECLVTYLYIFEPNYNTTECL